MRGCASMLPLRAFTMRLNTMIIYSGTIVALLGCSRLMIALADTVGSSSKAFAFNRLIAVDAWRHQHASAWLFLRLLMTDRHLLHLIIFMYLGRLARPLAGMTVTRVVSLRSSPVMYRANRHGRVSGMCVADLGTTVPAAFASLISAC